MLHYHIETHYALTIKLTTSTHDMVIVMGSNHRLNVFLYGGGTENRTLIYGLKARYFAVKLYPQRYLILCLSHGLEWLAMATRFFEQCQTHEGVTCDGGQFTTLHYFLLKNVLYNKKDLLSIWYPRRDSNPHEPIICCLRDINPPFCH